MQLHHILVPTDFSDGSAAAFAMALDLARDNGAKLTLLHVHHVPATALPDMLYPLTPQLVHDLERAAEQGLAELTAKARAAGVEAMARTRYGSTAREICEQAGELGVDLIVLGTHGRSGLSRAILGSVAERVVRRAPCPVLTVRPHDHASTGASP